MEVHTFILALLQSFGCGHTVMTSSIAGLSVSTAHGLVGFGIPITAERPQLNAMGFWAYSLNLMP
jgi:hypothetical protein